MPRRTTLSRAVEADSPESVDPVRPGSAVGESQADNIVQVRVVPCVVRLMKKQRPKKILVLRW